MLTPTEIDFFWVHGYLRIQQIFTAAEIDQMSNEMDWLIETWASRSPGWSGAWRQQYMDPETEKKSELIAMHDLSFYSESWMRVVTHDKLCDAMADLLGADVELHHRYDACQTTGNRSSVPDAPGLGILPASRQPVRGCPGSSG